MMDYQEQLKLQAYLDGELSEGEARDMADRLARDQEAAALLAELRNTRDALAGAEADNPLPESREFYWSKIRRDIERTEAPAPEPVEEPLLARLRRLLVPAAAIALVATAGLVASRGLVHSSGSGAEILLADAGALTYHDFSAGTTLVWLSYPAEKEVADDDGIDTFE